MCWYLMIVIQKVGELQLNKYESTSLLIKGNKKVTQVHIINIKRLN